MKEKKKKTVARKVTTPTLEKEYVKKRQKGETKTTIRKEKGKFKQPCRQREQIFSLYRTFSNKKNNNRT